MKKGLSESNSQDPKMCSWENNVYSQVKGLEKKGRIHCMGTISTSSSKYGPSCSQIIYHNEVQGLKVEVQGLKEALTTVISLFQKQFPNENVEVLNTVTRIVNGEVPDASSAQQTPRGNNHSHESSHQANPNASSKLLLSPNEKKAWHVVMLFRR
ncbi:hypothetical protein IHE45_07G056000 [Dioscorea alata]|uniref:Uncharacterized protein n=1 Tax=Dioscorea alata TaxID=55571 RepID=A0ACB7VRF5_DIOAL|nr:hypothetical protein IHE45_07G056000 [Dioscorea alata]